VKSIAGALILCTAFVYGHAVAHQYGMVLVGLFIGVGLTLIALDIPAKE
jgi:hypothetical protein